MTIPPSTHSRSIAPGQVFEDFDVRQNSQFSTIDKTMKAELPAPIADFFHAHNSGETDNFLELFTADAVVSDEAHEYRGDAIKTWIDDAIANYHPLHGEVISYLPSGRGTVATAQVSGTFPGSPVQLSYRFTLRDGRIAALSIAP